MADVATKKRCVDCGLEKDAAEFYLSHGRPEKHCKACRRVGSKTYYSNNKARIQKYVEKYRRIHQKQYTDYNRAWRTRNPERWDAHKAVRRAVYSGKLNPKPCQKCGSKVVHGHHENYNKLLAVTWLCGPHHVERHQQIKMREAVQ